jgi:hypothetical protein
MACVLASDAAFFHQTRLCIDTIEAARPALAGTELDIAVVGIGLKADQIAYLDERHIVHHDRLGDFPKFNGAPAHAVALTCRPYIPQFLPGYDGYMWVDSDIRFLSAGGLSYYANALGTSSASVVIVQETEPCYCVNTNVKTTNIYHSGSCDGSARSTATTWRSTAATSRNTMPGCSRCPPILRSGFAIAATWTRRCGFRSTTCSSRTP